MCQVVLPSPSAQLLAFALERRGRIRFRIERRARPLVHLQVRVAGDTLAWSQPVANGGVAKAVDCLAIIALDYFGQRIDVAVQPAGTGDAPAIQTGSVVPSAIDDERLATHTQGAP